MAILTSTTLLPQNPSPQTQTEEQQEISIPSPSTTLSAEQLTASQAFSRTRSLTGTPFPQEAVLSDTLSGFKSLIQ